MALRAAGAAALAAAIGAAAPAQAQGNRYTVTCESINYQRAECSVGGGPVTLTRQLSSPPGDCIQGRTWGFVASRNTIWVANGCRAQFSATSPRPPSPWQPGAELVTCESSNYRYAECYVPGGPVGLVYQLSTPPGDCIKGRTWGYLPNRNVIWVNNGCRAQFRVGYAPQPKPPSAEVVRCESRDYRPAECYVRGGPVSLLRQLSTPPGNCIEGRTWGYNGLNNSIWVSGGCRAEFRVGYDSDRWP